MYEDSEKDESTLNKNDENVIINDKEFLKEIKGKLGITWEDDDTDFNVRNCIKEGVTVLEEDVKSTIDFTSDILARGLLKTYCRYAWNNSEEYFFENNLHYILKLEVKYGKS